MNKNSNSLVSVIIPAYNAEKFIIATLNSVKAQTYSSWECIIVDDGSTDQTRNIIGTFENQDSRFRYIKGQHGGVSRARNLGISISQGDFIALLDHDDLWAPTKLEKQMGIFFQHPETGLVFCDAFIRSPRKTFRNFSVRKPFKGDVFYPLAKRNFIICQTAVIPRKLLLERKSPFIPELEMAEEYELFLWLAARYVVDFIDEPLATYIYHDGNDSLKRWNIIINEFKIIYNELNDDPQVKSCRKYRKALSALLQQAQYEEILLKWENGRSTLRDYFQFLRRCHFKTDWLKLIVMLFISKKTFKRFFLIFIKIMHKVKL
jgi:glycosyltransferase involved in cell wall biosynthesis